MSEVTRKKIYVMTLSFVLFATFIIDRWTKTFIVNNFQFDTSTGLIKNILFITPVKNTGIVFGLFPNSNYLSFIMFVIFLGIIILLFYKRILPSNVYVYTGLCLQLGGACGNIFDRIYYGYVIDFIDIRRWPIFNIADVAITIGTIIIILTIITQGKGEKIEVREKK